MKEPTFAHSKARGTSSAFSYGVERTAPPYTEEVMEMAAPCVQGWRNRNNCDCPPCKDWQSETMYGTRSAKAQSGPARGSKDGQQWSSGDGTIHTVNSTVDPNVASGGYYHTQVDARGNKATAVYNPDGSLADVKANRDWQ